MKYKGTITAKVKSKFDVESDATVEEVEREVQRRFFGSMEAMDMSVLKFSLKLRRVAEEPSPPEPED